MLSKVIFIESTMPHEHTLLEAQSDRFKASYLVPTIQNNPSFKTCLYQTASESRDELERFIFERFRNTHSAYIRKFMPTLVELNCNGRICSGVGIRSGAQGPFFLENYLDEPLAILLKSASSNKIDIQEVAEIGNFAADGVKSGTLLFTLLAKSLEQSGFKWMVFTATPEIGRMISRLGSEQIFLSTAQPEKLGSLVNDWGTYYDKTPRVIACSLTTAIAAAEANAKLNDVFARYVKEINTLAHGLDNARGQS